MVVTAHVRGTHVTEAHDRSTPRQDVVAVGNKYAAFATAKVLVLVKREGPAVTNRTDFPPFVKRPMGLAGILDDPQVVLPGDRHDRVHIAGNPPVMDHEYCLGPVGDRGFDLGWIEMHGIPVDIHENWNDHVVKDAGRGGGPAQRRGDDLIPGSDIAAGDTDVQGCSSVAGGNAVFVAVLTKHKN